MIDREEIREQWAQGKLLPPQVNIYETKDEYILMARMPGVKKDAVEVKLSDGHLTIYGKTESQEPCECFVLREIDEGNYYRVFKVSDSLDVEKIQARLENGLLRVHLPKHERVKPREIPVELS